MTEDRRNILLCVAIFLLAAAATYPVLEMGINDDWAYIHMARQFAAEGRLVYNGWAAAMMVPQMMWGALFIKLFGFSFFVLRLSTVALAVPLIPLLYWICRESGLSPPFATFATLLTTISPLYLPEALSFMSDVPALFFFVLCFYAGIKAWKAATARDCIRWVWVVAVSGIMAALDRQVYWLAPLWFVLAVAFVQRRKKNVLVNLAAAGLLVIVAAGSSVLWLQSRPYMIVEHTFNFWMHAGIRELAMSEFATATSMAITIAAVLMPMLVGFIAPGLRSVSRVVAAVILALALARGIGVATGFYHGQVSMGNVLTDYGSFAPDTVAPGAMPIILGPMIRAVIAAVVVLSCLCCGLVLWKFRGALAGIWQDPVAPSLFLALGFTAGWISMLLYRSVNAPGFDRYLIPFLLLAALPLLRLYQVHVRPSVSPWSWIVLVVFGLYGVANTHDVFAAGRARLQQAQKLEQAGIPRTEIIAGFDYDGWTELETAGYINQYEIEKPPGAYRRVVCPGERFWFEERTPAIRARYFVTFSHLPNLEKGPIPPSRFTTWLAPPREVLTEVLPGGAYAECR